MLLGLGLKRGDLSNALSTPHDGSIVNPVASLSAEEKPTNEKMKRKSIFDIFILPQLEVSTTAGVWSSPSRASQDLGRGT